LLLESQVQCLQGAEIMSKFGVNVPPGKPVFTLDEVATACDELADSDGEVGSMQ